MSGGQPVYKRVSSGESPPASPEVRKGGAFRAAVLANKDADDALVPPPFPCPSRAYEY